MTRFRPGRVIAILTATTTVLVSTFAAEPAARADITTVSYDTLRTGWDPNEPSLSPANVSASDFGELFAAQLDGQIYAQPVIAKNVVFAATENDRIYGLDPVTGAQLWSRDVGPSWPASAIGCGDLVPNIGVTSTPVYDPSTGTVYFTAKVNDGSDVDQPHWYMHAVDITSGAERHGFPTAIAGAPNNDPSDPFNPETAMQRPGLLLLGGVVYAGFASHCDYGPYVGYVVGVNASTGHQTAMWSTEAGTADGESGIWQSGGGLVSDGPGRIILATGNGIAPTSAPSNAPPNHLSESVVRLQVANDGTLSAVNFFSPVNNTNLDTNDTDLGSGAPMALPDGYGTSAHPHLLVEDGKDGRVFLLDRDNLGGEGQGPGQTDAVLQTGGPYNGVWGHPGFWGGDGGYVYLVTNGGPMRALQVGVSGSGLPSLAATGATSGSWGYTSGSPVVTSTGTTSGSALVWAVYSSGSNGSGGQLRAYDPVPVNGVLTERYSAPIGTASKFAVPATDKGRVYVGSRDGVLFGFGRPATSTLTGSPTDFGSVPVGDTTTRSVTVTASRTVTIKSVSADAPFTAGSVRLPTTLTAGQKLTVPVTFSPTDPSTVSGTLSFDTDTDSGSLGFALSGTGTKDGLAASPPTLAFGDVPLTGTRTLSVVIRNTGTTTTTIRKAIAPKAPFTAGSLPVKRSTLAPGASVSVPVTFAPTATGADSSRLVVHSSTGAVTVAVTGNGVAGAPHLTLTPFGLDFGTVAIGHSMTKTFTVSNTGNLLLTLTKAAPPAAPFTVPNPIAEGQQLEPGDSLTVSVTFRPTAAGASTGTYQITGAAGSGAKSVTVQGIGAKVTPFPLRRAAPDSTPARPPARAG